MKKFLLLMVSAFLWSMTSASFAIMQPTATYDTSEAFLAAEGAMCKTATDGCNTISIQDGQLWASTLMACVDETGNMQKEVWSCKEYNDNIMFMTGGPIVGGDADVHGCIGSAGYSWNEAQQSCLRIWEQGLSDNDQNFYTTFQSRLTPVQNYVVAKVFQKYQDKVMVYSPEDRVVVNQKVISRLEKKISDFLLKYPQDIALPYKADMYYKRLTLLKFEMQIWAKKLSERLASLNQLSYTCDSGKTLTVFRKDYIVDDMAFVVEKDEIHVSDGQFMLPNYVATREISASGEKFVGRDTETQDAVTFWFKNDEVSMYRGDTLEATCTTDAA